MRPVSGWTADKGGPIPTCAFGIRPATPDDADAIAEAHMDSIRTLGPKAYPVDIVSAWGSPRDGSRYREAMKTDSFFIAVSSETGRTCLRFSSLRKADGIRRIAVYVRGNTVRKGLGKNLYIAAETAARANGVRFIVLDRCHNFDLSLCRQHYLQT